MGAARAIFGRSCFSACIFAVVFPVINGRRSEKPQTAQEKTKHIEQEERTKERARIIERRMAQCEQDVAAILNNPHKATPQDRFMALDMKCGEACEKMHKR
jgi:hypothetical protein